MMSHRGKRQALPRLDDITPVATKRRKGRAATAAEEEEASALEQRQSYSSAASDMKVSSIYNRSVTDAPAELFRKDLISAMKLPDSEPLTSDHYWVITDQWKQEWERGVQVPVKPDSLPGPVVNLASSYVNNPRKMHHEFKLPKNKYIRITKDEHFRVDEHYLSNVSIQAEKSCAYDLEDVDVVWLNILNGERALMGLRPITQDQLERVIEELEMRCWEKVHAIVKKEEGLALEFDESVICDVCRSPDSEEGNEMVFCDCCNICVHQACYGITSIPAGSWLCRTCALGLRPECVLCPNKNGAMKSTRSGQKWAHVSCALWIPEVSIGCVEKMEPITKISGIPQSRWALICVLCRERVGACIQCSVKTCKTAYHVTCAFKHGLEMRAIIDEESTTDDDNTVKLRSYCQKHSISSKKESSCIGGTASDEEVKKKQRKDMTTEEKTHARAVKLQEIEAEFEKHVNVKDITRKYDVDPEGLEYIYNYWVLKRRASFNKPLLAPRSEDASNVLNKNQEQVDQEKMSMFIQLRQDLERVRNLCYMVSRREKLSRTYQRLREQTFYKQAALLSDTRINLSAHEITAIKDANHGPSIYDRLYSHANAPDLSTDFETMLHTIAGDESNLSPRHGVNGYIFSSSSKDSKRSCLNGDICKNSSFYESMSSSVSDIDSKSHVGVETESDTHSKLNNRMNKSQRKNNVENRNKNTARRRKKTSPTSYLDSTTSTDVDEDNEDDSSISRLLQRSKKNSGRSKKQPTSANRSFELLERRMLGSRSGSVTAGDDDTEDDLFNLGKHTKGSFKKKAVSEIYSSDSDSSDKDPSRPASRKLIRTKASVKEFSAAEGGGRLSKDHGSNHSNKSVSFSASKVSVSSTSEKRKRVNDLFEEESDDTNKGKSIEKFSASESDVFVPQRKAIRAANESSVPSKNKSRLKGDKTIPKSEKEKKSPLHEKKTKKESPLETENYSNDGNSGANYLDTLMVVPQRAAARKAIEHIKNGMVKPATNFDDLEMDVFKNNVKPSKIIKKEPHSSTVKQKTADLEDIKLDSKTTAVDKRTIPPETTSSISSTCHSLDSANSFSAHVPTNSVSHIVTTSVTSNISGSSSPITSSSAIASATTTCTTMPSTASAVISKHVSSSSSGSSSGSSSSGSSSSTSSSSSSTSSSSDSSGSGSSSSSSSESESEEAPTTFTKKKPSPVQPVSEISTASPIGKSVPECQKCETELISDRNQVLDITCNTNQKVLNSLETPNNELNQKAFSPQMEKDSNEYSNIDNESFMETKTAIEHLETNEQNFPLPSSCWDTTIDNKVPIKVENILDEEKKQSTSPVLSSSRNRSLFSPIKDLDLSSFDDDMNESNNLADGSFSLTSLSFSFGSDIAYKEDTKEDSVRETLNLVEKLKFEMARKKNSHSDNGEAPLGSTSDLNETHVIEENEEKPESSHRKTEMEKSKSDESDISDNSYAVTTSSDNSTVMTTEAGVVNETSPTDAPPSAISIFSSCSFPSNILQQKENSSVTKEPIIPNENQNEFSASWHQSAATYEESNSPYQHDITHSTDRWSESVMIPSRRSDCSSVSISSASSSSSAYSEPHHANEIIPTAEEVARIDEVSTLEISQHMQKSVTDLLRPSVSVNEDQFTSSSNSESLYPYEDHLSSFVKATFNSTITDKALYPHDPQQVSQSSSLFQPPLNYDAISNFGNTNQILNKSYVQSMSIQTPLAATASFTTTSQNMAMITSIISQVPAPSSDEIAATPVSAGSVNFDEKFADIVSESAELATDVLSNATNIDSNKNEPSPSQKNKSNYASVNEKENNLFTIATDVSEASVHPVRPSSNKVDSEIKADFHKISEEPVITVTNSLFNDSSVRNTPVAAPPQKTPTTCTSTKKSPGKPTRVSARVMSQNKSPVAKSPVTAVVSPAASETPPVSKSKSRDQSSRKNHRTSNKGALNRRGRGRGRGRSSFPNFYRDWDGDTICDKLVGTVYDFDDEEEAPGDNFENLRAMRERRKSTDTAYCDRLSTSSKDTSYSPKFASPSSQPQHSKRKGSVASTPDRRTSHRSQLSPLCEISNNGRVLPKDLYRDSVGPTEEDDEEEDEQPAEEEEEDEEEQFVFSEKKSTPIRGSKSDKNISSPTLPQPPTQSTEVEQFSAVQPLLPGPVDMRTYSGGVYDSASISDFDGGNSANADSILSTAFSATTSTAAELVPDIVDDLEKEIERYSSSITTSSMRSLKSSPAVARSPTISSDIKNLDERHDRLSLEHASSSPTHFYVAEHSNKMRTEASSTFIVDDENSASRNQLKMKIKGPYSDANYASFTTTSSSISVQQMTSISSSSAVTVDGFAVSAGSFVNTTVSSASSSNLRRMRKKELLEQYKAQGVLDECGNDIAAVSQNNNVLNDTNAGVTNNTPIKSGPSYKLPKAVASMTTIPTKEDYKAVLETALYIEKKKRGKDKTSNTYDAADITNNNNNSSSNCNNNMYHNNKQSNIIAEVRSPDKKSSSTLNNLGGNLDLNVTDNHVTKRKSRSSSSAPPKLKIKIGNPSLVVLDNSSCSVISSEDKNLRLRPPKKRLCDQSDVQPSPAAYESLKSMRVRGQTLSEFSENGDCVEDYFSDNEHRSELSLSVVAPSSKHSDSSVSKKRKKRSSSTNASKSSKRKKRQQRSNDDIETDNQETNTSWPHVRVITNDDCGGGRAPKIIIKFKGLNPPPEPASSFSSSAPPPPMPTKPPKSSKRNMNQELDSVRTNKITPIRLKFSRSKEGYVTNCIDKETVVEPSTPAPVAMLPDASLATDTIASQLSGNISPKSDSAGAQVSAISTSTS